MKGRRKVTQWLKPWDMDCMCAIRVENGQDKRFRCLWTGYGSRCQVHRFVSWTATLLDFSHSSFPCVSRMVHPKDIQPTWQLWEAWVNVDQQPCGTLSTRDAGYKSADISDWPILDKHANIGIGPMSSLTPILNSDVKATVHTYIA
jgi:hypothetical protein